MRNVVLVTLIAVMISLLSSPLSFAEDMKGMAGDSSSHESQGMMGGMMMEHMMMKSMMDKSVVPTEDGGIVIVAGNKIMKYDKDLNLVKEAEIKMDMDAMQKNMMEMMRKCTMMKGDMMSGEGSSQPAETAKDSGHEAHH